jgi:hypothetical protein
LLSLTRCPQAGVDTNLKMSHVSKEGYGAIPDYKEIAEQSKKVAILQVIIVFVRESAFVP